GVREEIIKNEVESFEGLSHRLERVRIHNGIEFIDDSKATNPSSLYSALDAIEKPVILLVGGKNKGSKFDLIATKLKNKCKAVILFGEAADEIESYLGVLNVSVIKEKKLGDAIKEAFGKAVSGDVILLSPGCASFDEFSSYRERGEFFKNEISRRIGNENAKVS
ncbi:MAG: UDP-N-acetylmuramoyl-L-alanine--D-glutamate ligase, partial [Actinomycetia bacterium]|nr:UDP-N-acetylmuramoyl-L-alanine--D-glutamate ligase [Actinomycetes bacterium]